MATSKKNSDLENEENIFIELFNKYLPYWPLFAILSIISLALTFVYLHYAIPTYETTATILVKDEKKGVDDSNLMEQLNLFGSKKLVENEIEVIRSRTLFHKVVDNLYLYAPIQKEQRFNSLPAYTYSPVAIEARYPDSLIQTGKKSFSYLPNEQAVLLGNRKIPLNTWFQDTSGNKLRFIINPNYDRSQINNPYFYSVLNPKLLVDALIRRIKILQATKLSSVIDLSLTDAIPKRGEDILNDLINEYNRAAVEDKNMLASNTLRFINDHLASVAGELDSVETGIQKFKTQEKIVDISAQGEQYLESVTANQAKLSEVSVQIAVLDQVEKYVESKSDQPGIVPSTFGITDPVLMQLVGKLYDLEIQYEGLKKTTAENNPILVAAKNEIERIKPSVLENIRSQRRNLEAGKNNLTATSEGYSSLLLTIPKKEKRLMEISRQQIIKNNIYTYLLQKREETALTYYSTIADTRIVDHAETSLQPVSPKKLKMLMMAIGLALLVTIGYITIREGFNRFVIFRSDIENYTDTPIIGEISFIPSAGALVVEDGGRSISGEQFRQVRSSLAYIGINSRKKRLLITSTISGEGKSFITANLGLSLAVADKKVVLIELDLRKPKLSKIFNISREVGITNYLVGNKEPDQIIKKTTQSKNLFIIPSGAIPPNPSELILNGKLEELLKYLDDVFDYIIIDTTPVAPVADAYILSPFCDATLYVVRHAVTPKHFIKRLDENLKVRGLNNLAIIFNGIKKRGISGNGYGYGYASSYDGYYMEETEKRTIIDRLLRRSKSLS